MPRNNDFIMEVEQRIAKRVNEARLMAGWNHGKLANHLGVTHQQAKKYMDGSNRISAGKLHFIAKALRLPITYFFEEHEEDRILPLKLTRNFSKLSQKQQERVMNIIEEIVKTSEE